MIIAEVFTGPAGSGKTTKLRRVASSARARGLKVLEVCASSIYKGDLERLIAQDKPDVLLIDEFDALDCTWHPTDLAGPADVQIYYTITTG